MKQMIWKFKNNSETYNVIYEDEKYVLVQLKDSDSYSFGLKRDFGTLCGFPVNQSCLIKNECIDILNRFIEIDKKYDDCNKTMQVYQDMICELKKTPIKCEICGKEIEKSYYHNINVCSSECFNKHFWKEYIKIKDHKQVVRINGNHYWISEDNSQFKGYNGAKHTIQFNDGRIVKTNNLWHNGEIPEEFREALPDNARFI